MSDELRECQRRLAELEEENTALRAASRMFGDLAERLNHELQVERRSNPDRRVALRPTGDRRSSSTSASPEGEPATLPRGSTDP